MPIGSVIGAYILMIVVNILLVLNVSAYYSTIAEGAILILAVLAGSLSRSSRASEHSRLMLRRLGAWTRACCHARDGACRSAWRFRPGKRAGHDRASASFIERHRETAALRPAGLCVLPRWCCC